MGTTTPPLGRLDPDDLRTCTREVYWWAVRFHGASLAVQSDADARGIQPSLFRGRLLDAWAEASPAEHARLRIAYPGYAAAVLMFQLRGVAGVAELLASLEADLADLAAERRARSVTHA